jgi:hypothetical protein
MTYADAEHEYYFGGYKAKSVTGVAKIAADQYHIDQWTKRTVAVGMLYDHAHNGDALREELAVDPNDKALGNIVAEKALELAKAHAKAARGTQMHRVLELTLLNRLRELLTDQQRRDAEVLRRTLDRYGLEPYEGLVEQFVAYPEYRVTGRFDAVLRGPGGVAIYDLKSGPNAIEFPHSTCVQLALYARAPHVSAVIEEVGDKQVVTEWRTMPPELDLDRAYVLLVPPDAEVGTLHEVDIAHGWKAGQMALEIVNWRKAGRQYNRETQKSTYDWVNEVPGADAEPYLDPAVIDPTLRALPFMSAKACKTLTELRELWNAHAASGSLTPTVKTLLEHRARELKATA